MQTYSGGRICRLKLQSFLTYDDLELYPSTGLNLIIGLNGTGKSSIVCGICLGLAGKPQFTGRTTQISDFIKHGCREASIEIELENKGSSNVIIKRKIKQDNKSLWFLNGKMAQINEVTNVISHFNIQTNNLCQFLPQERVSEFSKMDKKQRLENMLQAIGDQNLFTMFNELKDLQKSYYNAEHGVADLKKNLEMEKQKNERLRVDVDREHEKADLQNRVQTLKDKRKFLEYTEIAKDYQEIKDLKEKRQTEKTRLKAEKTSLFCFEKKLDDELVSYRQDMKELDGNIDKTTKSLSVPFLEVKKMSEGIQEAKIEFTCKIEEKNSQKKKIQDLKQQIIGLQNSYNDCQLQNEDIAKKMTMLKMEAKELQEKKSDILSKRKGFAIERNQLKAKIEETETEILELKNEDNKKMEVLSRRDKDTYQAAVWVKNNRDKFQAPVHLPILTTLKVHRSGDEKYIETHIPFRDMIAFVCENKEDSKLLVDILREEKRLAVNTVLAPQADLSNFRPQMSNQELRKMHFKCYLKDLFSAPDGVMRYLCNLYNVHQTPVGDEEAENYIKSSDSNNFPFPICYTTNCRYTRKRSKYGNRNPSVTMSYLRNPSLLVSSIDVTDRLKMVEANLRVLIQQKERCDAEFSSLGEKEDEFSAKIELLRKKMKEYEDKDKSLKTLVASLSQKNKLKKDLESRVIDEEQERKLTSERISSNYKQQLHHFNSIHNKAKVLLRYREEKFQMCLYYSSLLKKIAKNKKAINEANEKYDSAVEAYESTREICKKMHDKALVLYEQVKEITSNPEWEQKSIYVGNFDNVEEIDEEIEELQARIDLNPGADESVIAEYHTRVKSIADMEKKVENNTGRLSNINAKIAERKERWLTPLEGHIKKINEKFKEYYKLLKCAGEINLDKCNDSNEFDKYGLQIMLKYRDSEPLIELSQTHHSGGECSVAAILFILSLQGLTDVPFRCIDEINQGMDKINERKVFELISSSACNESSSQYFLLTPNLLDNLNYHENMKIHIIHNGPFLGIQWNLKAILENRKSFP